MVGLKMRMARPDSRAEQDLSQIVKVIVQSGDLE